MKEYWETEGATRDELIFGIPMIWDNEKRKTPIERERERERNVLHPLIHMDQGWTNGQGDRNSAEASNTKC